MLTMDCFTDRNLADQMVTIAARVLNQSFAVFELFNADDGTTIDADDGYAGDQAVAVSWTLPPPRGARAHYGLQITPANVAGNASDALISVTQFRHALLADDDQGDPIQQPARIPDIGVGGDGLADIFINY